MLNAEALWARTANFFYYLNFLLNLLRNRLVTVIFVTDQLHNLPGMRRDVFQAIADPTRREIIDLLTRQRLNLNGIADNFDISRPAISKHIKILIECGLVTVKQEGRERYCEARLNKLQEVNDWTGRYRSFWENKLDALEKFLEKSHHKRKRK